MEEILAGLGVLYVARCDRAATGSAWQIFLPAGAIVRAAERLRAAGWHLEDVFALDCLEGYVVTYHFDRFDAPERATFRVVVPHEKPEVPSIAGAFPGAEWHERETRDFHGVVFAGNPNFVPLLLSPEMADCFPLRKEPEVRVGVRILLAPGDVLFCAPGFDLMNPEAPAPADAQSDKARSGSGTL